MTRLELSIAWRYLRSGRRSQFLSLISLIAMGGVTVAVGALVVTIGVMNGLQTDLREKILIGSPDIRVLTFTSDLILNDWQSVLERVRRQPGVVAAAPFVTTRAVVQAARGKFFEAATIQGIVPDGPGVSNVTTIRFPPGPPAVFRNVSPAPPPAAALKSVHIGAMCGNRSVVR